MYFNSTAVILSKQFFQGNEVPPTLRDGIGIQASSKTTTIYLRASFVNSNAPDVVSSGFNLCCVSSEKVTRVAVPATAKYVDSAVTPNIKLGAKHMWIRGLRGDDRITPKQASGLTEKIYTRCGIVRI